MVNFFKVRLWSVIGDAGSGKSTIVGNLVSQFGPGRTHARRVLLRGGGYLLVHARRQSLQEANISAKQFIRAMNATAQALQRQHGLTLSYLNVLAAIRTENGVNGLPSAIDYISEFVRASWSIESIVVLDYDERADGRYHSFGAPIYEVNDSSALVRQGVMHQKLVGQVRNHFGWA